jgi:hypothetical protein
MRTSFLKVVTFVAISLVVSSCGKTPQVVTGIQVQSSTIDQDVVVSLKADLNLGNMSFPAVTLPIVHPQTRSSIGSVELVPVLGGKNQIKVSVNVSAVSNIRAVQAYLPNGNAIPLIAANPTIEVALGAGAKLYLTIGANAVALGVAVPIKQFDSLGASLGGINLFPVFTIDQAIGAAGIFTGAQAGQNGFALIVDVTKYVNMQDIFVPQVAADMMIASAKRGAIQEEQATVKLNYNSQAPSKSKEDRLNNMIYNLNQKKTKLTLR